MHIYLAASRYRKFSPVANLTSVNNCYIYIHFFVGGGGGGIGVGVGRGNVPTKNNANGLFFLKAKYIYINQ